MWMHTNHNIKADIYQPMSKSFLLRGWTVNKLVAPMYKNNLERVFLSGAVELSSYEDDYVLPKTILLALLQEELTQQAPPAYFSKRKQMEKDAKNIYIMI